MSSPAPPARSLAITLFGAALAAFALRRRGLLGLLASAGSALLAARALRDARRNTTQVPSSHGITIDRPRRAVYRFWRDFANLPDIVEALQRVDVIDSHRSHWVMDAPLGQTVEWDVEIVEDQTNERIAWTAIDRDVASHGWVEFHDARLRRGTEVRAMMVLDLPARQVGRVVAEVFRRDPGASMRDVLLNLKRRLEDLPQRLQSS